MVVGGCIVSTFAAPAARRAGRRCIVSYYQTSLICLHLSLQQLGSMLILAGLPIPRPILDDAVG